MIHEHREKLRKTSRRQLIQNVCKVPSCWTKVSAATTACQENQEDICYFSSVQGDDISNGQWKHISWWPLPLSSPVVCSAEIGQS